MKHKFTADSHVHSSNSFDAKSTVGEMLDRANGLGLDFLTITDHFEAAFYHEANGEFGDQTVLLPKSISDVRAQQNRKDVKTELLCGIELGEPLHDLSSAEEALALTEYDFVLCSVHNLKEMGDFFWLDYSEKEIPSLLKKYFLELSESTQWGRFNSLAHISYPLRYICGRAGISVDISDYKKEIDELLKLLAEKEKALEFNTCRNSLLSAKTMSECRDIYFLKRFKELGGKYITLGSDAHKAEELAMGIDGAMDILLQLGYGEITVFKGGKPHLLPII